MGERRIQGKQIRMKEKNEDNKKKIKKPAIEIREMNIDDLPTVFHIGEDIFTAEKVQNLYRTWDEMEVTSVFLGNPELCLVAESENKVVGFILGTVIEKRQSPWKYGYILWLGVCPEFQFIGTATRLFQSFYKLMKNLGVRILMVDTEESNAPAIKFFTKLGFSKPQRQIFLSLNISQEKNQLKSIK